MADMAREEGCACDIDIGALAEIDDWFIWVAYEQGKAIAEEKPSIQPIIIAMSVTKYPVA